MSGISTLSSIFWITPLLPLAVFVLLAIGLSRFGRLAAILSILALAFALLIAVIGLIVVSQGIRVSIALPWLNVGGRTLTLALLLDPLSGLVVTLVALIGLIVFVYAASYMADDAYEGRFFAELSLFIGSMLTLVLAGDLITLFIAWELVGLCSYLLIGFWFERPAPPAASTKAFFTTRLADLCLLAGILLLIGAVGNGNIPQVLAYVHAGKISAGVLFGIAILLFVGAAGKSAQFPFQGWLPDAMAGPTPVSALLHSATMVAAGVFLVARLYPLFLAAGPALHIVAWIGVLTSLIGGFAALTEPDLKRTLAYSTMSQIGLMFVGLGSGSLLAGMLLLVAQAFYKATLFLAAGVIDHGVESTTFDHMGGLFRRMPLTGLAFALSAAALAGLPVTLALPPKDPVLAAAWVANAPLFIVTLLASLLTALYSTRAFSTVFLGIPSVAAQHPRSIPTGLLVPLLVIAVLVPFALLANAALIGSPLAHLLNSTPVDVPIATTITLIIAFVGVIIGIVARLVWPRYIVWPVLRPVSSILAGEFGLRAVYALIARFGLWSAKRLYAFDQFVFDGLANGLVRATLSMIKASELFDSRGINAAVTDMGRGILALGQRIRVLQTGHIENYLFVALLWSVGVIAVALVAAFIH